MTREDFCIWALRSFSWWDDFRYMSMTGTQQAGGKIGAEAGNGMGYKSKDMGRVFFSLLVSRGHNKQSDWNTLGSQTCVAVFSYFPQPFLLFLLLFFYFYVGEKSRDAALKKKGGGRPPMRSIETMMNVVYEGTVEFRPRNAMKKRDSVMFKNDLVLLVRAECPLECSLACLDGMLAGNNYLSRDGVGEWVIFQQVATYSCLDECPDTHGGGVCYEVMSTNTYLLRYPMYRARLQDACHSVTGAGRRYSLSLCY